MKVTITPLGDEALVVTLADRVEASSARRIHAAAVWLEAASLPGIREIVPAATTLTVFYCLPTLAAAGAPREDLAGGLTEGVLERLATLPVPKESAARRIVEVPVCYGGAFGPDMEQVAAQANLSTAEVIARHCAADFFVLQLGFSPGFPYLHGLPPELALPRRATPRTAVAPGSVGIANRQSCIYPLATPGGWNLIGRTPLRLFRPEQEPPVLLQQGDHVRFRAISPEEFARLEATA